MGFAGKVMIGANTVAEITGWKLDLGSDMVDVTTLNNTTAWKAFLAGLKEWSGSAEGNADFTDTNGQKAIFDAWVAGTSLAAKFYLDGTHYLSGTVFVKGEGIEVGAADANKISFDFQGTGALTYS